MCRTCTVYMRECTGINNDRIEVVVYVERVGHVDSEDASVITQQYSSMSSVHHVCNVDTICIVDIQYRYTMYCRYSI